MSEPRFTMLATIQEYAQERLVERREADSIRWQHATFFLELAEAAEQGLEGPERADWLLRLEQEHDNLRAALTWSQSALGGKELGLRLAGALWVFWFEHGYRHEGRRWLEATLAHSNDEVAPVSRVKVLDGAVVLAIAHGDYRQAQVLAEEGLALSRDAGHMPGIAGALSGLGEVAVLKGDYARAAVLYEESLAVSQELADTWLIANALSRLGDVAYLQGDYMRAVTLFEQSLTLSRELNDQAGIAWALGKLGRTAHAQSDSARALVLCEESLSLYRILENKGDIAQLLGILGHIVHAQSDSTRAAALFAESLSIYQELGDTWGIATGLAGLAGLLSDLGQPEQAARLFGAAEALREIIGAQMGMADRAEYAQAVVGIQSQLAVSTIAAAWAAGRTLSSEQAIVEARELARVPAPSVAAASMESRAHQAVPASSALLVEPLSARELEVLRLIADGHSNQEIADILVVAVSTVKRHINNIYGKLGVQSRTQALVRARELHLL